MSRSFAAVIARIGTRGRNLGWNLAGQVLPMLTGIVFVPLLIHALGTDRFGFLSLVWVLIGYFSLFDLGLSRALTQRVAVLQATGDDARLRTAVATGMGLIVALSLAAVPLLLLFKNVLLSDIVHTSAGLAGEAGSAFVWLVVGVPVVILAAGVRGVLEGQHRFVAVNAVRTPAGMAMFIAPWLATRISPTLEAVTLAVFLVRLVQLGGFVVLARGLLGNAVSRLGFDRTEVRMLFGFGLWMTVTNIVGPVLVYLDRFAISHFGNLSDVAYYSTPFDLVTRLLFISTAVSGVMFPALSGAIAAGGGAGGAGEVARLQRQNYAILLVLLGPLVLGILLLAGPGLRLWLGAAFAAHSTDVLRILTVGVFINALTTVPFSVLQARRRADLTAKTHLLELPFYLGLLVFLVQHYGILGAALAWLARVAFDFAAMLWLERGQRTRALQAVPA